MKILIALVLLLPIFSTAQKITAEDKKVMANLKTNITFLANDKLEGRRTGTNGEKLAYEYIQAQLKKIGLLPYAADKTYVQSFPVKEGKAIKTSELKINGTVLKLNKDFFPLAYSGKIYNTTFGRAPFAVHNVQELINANTTNPHYDINEALYTLAKAAENNNKGAVFFICPTGTKHSLKFDEKDKAESLAIPVIVMQNFDKNFAKESEVIECEIEINAKEKFGHNIVSYIDNKAASTIILGAHYDHLGYGEDHNSLYSGETPMIHNGADDNASGTAALIEMARWLKKSTLKKYNYLFVNFSGEELGLFGSKYFTDHAGLDLKTVNYMINMDMVGRLNDSIHGITIGGYGTSPSWGRLIKKEDKYFKINIDSAGSGPSDHTSFYKKDIPVLFFFTGSHKDYHKPSDDADKINYKGELEIIKYIQNIIAQTNNMDKLAFTKTREVSMGKSSFKVSLGVMPDYTFTGVGVLVDGVSENKPAQKAGIKVGDVLLQLGEHKFEDVQSYMGALNKFNKGETTNVKVQRGKEELLFPITF
jgi:aminopeptidase YwaD